MDDDVEIAAVGEVEGEPEDDGLTVTPHDPETLGVSVAVAVGAGGQQAGLVASTV